MGTAEGVRKGEKKCKKGGREREDAARRGRACANLACSETIKEDEFGKRPAGKWSGLIVTQSGNNQWHGTAFEFHAATRLWMSAETSSTGAIFAPTFRRTEPVWPLPWRAGQKGTRLSVGQLRGFARSLPPNIGRGVVPRTRLPAMHCAECQPVVELGPRLRPARLWTLAGSRKSLAVH